MSTDFTAGRAKPKEALNLPVNTSDKKEFVPDVAASVSGV
jgi:hypothetical protein